MVVLLFFYDCSCISPWRERGERLPASSWALAIGGPRRATGGRSWSEIWGWLLGTSMSETLSIELFMYREGLLKPGETTMDLKTIILRAARRLSRSSKQLWKKEVSMPWCPCYTIPRTGRWVLMGHWLVREGLAGDKENLTWAFRCYRFYDWCFLGGENNRKAHWWNTTHDRPPTHRHLENKVEPDSVRMKLCRPLPWTEVKASEESN